MIRPIFSRLYWWAHNITERRRLRVLLATLNRQLANHDMDIASMEHFPQPVRDRMLAYRARLVEQIETARRVV